jgi:hypothetical protein
MMRMTDIRGDVAVACCIKCCVLNCMLIVCGHVPTPCEA